MPGETSPLPLTWLLVTGPARSGTTVLRNILNENPEVALLHEHGLGRLVSSLDRLFDREEELGLQLEIDDQRLDAAKTIAGGIDAARNAEPSRIMSSLPGAPQVPRRRQHFSSIARALFSALFSGKQIRVIGDKRPITNWFEDVPFLKRTLADLRVIFIIRSPLDTVNSSLRRRNKGLVGEDLWHVGDVSAAIREWASSWEALGEFRRLFGKALHVLRYEDLCSDGPHAIREMDAFLGVAEHVSTITLEPPSAELMRQGFRGDELASAVDALGEIEGKWLAQPLEKTLQEHPVVGLPYVPGAEVSFHAGGDGTGYLRQGFSDPEDWGCWTENADARLVLRFDGDPADLEMRLSVAGFEHAHGSICLSASCNGEQLASYLVPRQADGSELGFLIPERALRSDRMLDIRLSFMGLRPPAGSDDRRLLGLPLTALTIAPRAPLWLLPGVG